VPLVQLAQRLPVLLPVQRVAEVRHIHAGQQLMSGRCGQILHLLDFQFCDAGISTNSMSVLILRKSMFYS